MFMSGDLSKCAQGSSDLVSPEGCWRLAGGVNHRNVEKMEFAPEGRWNKRCNRNSIAPAGTGVVVARNPVVPARGLASPPANFRHAFGVVGISFS